MSMTITVVGSGYVGTVVAACFASIGHRVTGLETDPAKLDRLRAGYAPFFEPGLDDLVTAGIDSGRLAFTDDPATAVAGTDLVFLCVGTPSRRDGRPDLTAVEAATRAVGGALEGSCVFVTKSTVPIGSGAWLEDLVGEAVSRAGRPPLRVAVASNPEFLREGNAVADFLHPDRVVVGSQEEWALDLLTAAYRPILDQSFQGGKPDRMPGLVRTDLATAETTKYAANAFLATKVSFINEIARICDAVGADVVDVARGIGLDARIGAHFLAAGAGWGGSCFGKDIDALAATASDHGFELQILEATKEVNRRQREQVMERLIHHLGDLAGRRVALLGLAFKPGTDDVRDAPALDVAHRLLGRGAEVAAFDPAVKEVPGLAIEYHSDAYGAVRGADAVLLMTEWPEFLRLDLAAVRELMRGRLLFDARNLFRPDEVLAAGFAYEAFGRGRHRTAPAATG